MRDSPKSCFDKIIREGWKALQTFAAKLIGVFGFCFRALVGELHGAQRHGGLAVVRGAAFAPEAPRGLRRDAAASGAAALML